MKISGLAGGIEGDRLGKIVDRPIVIFREGIAAGAPVAIGARIICIDVDCGGEIRGGLLMIAFAQIGLAPSAV